MSDETRPLISSGPTKKGPHAWREYLHKAGRLLKGSHSIKLHPGKTFASNGTHPPELEGFHEKTAYAEYSWYLNAAQIKVSDTETITGVQLFRNYRYMVWNRYVEDTAAHGPSTHQSLEFTVLAEQLDALYLSIDDAAASALGHIDEDDRLRAVGLGLMAILPIVMARDSARRPDLLAEMHDKATQSGQTEIVISTGGGGGGDDDGRRGSSSRSQSVWVNTFYLRTCTAALAYVFRCCHELRAEDEDGVMDIAWKWWYAVIVRMLLGEEE